MTGDSNLIVYLFLGAIGFYVLAVVSRMWDSLMKRLAFGAAGFFAALLVAEQAKMQEESGFALAVVAGIAAALLVRTPRATRRIPKSVRDAVIARDLKGKRFDGRRYHIDHIVPLSKGGDNSESNLRVVPKRKNLRKGAKMPDFGDF